MPDPASTIQRTTALLRVDPVQGIAWFYMLNSERDIFGTVRLIRTWGRIGVRGREMANVFDTEQTAAETLERLAAVERRRGYGTYEGRLCAKTAVLERAYARGVLRQRTEAIMLTGRFDFRRTFTGKVVLQVEEHASSFWSRKGNFRKRWRNAAVMDLASTELRRLMDLRANPHTEVEVSVAQPMPASSENIVPLRGTGQNRR